LTNNGSTIKIGDQNASVSGGTALSVKGSVSGIGVTYLNRFEVESTQSSGSGVNLRIQTSGEGAGANHMGIYNQVTGSTGTHYGNYTFLTGSTLGTKYGSAMTISGGTGAAYGYQASLTGSGENYAAHLSASGGTSNYALFASSGNAYFADRVGFGTLSPSYPVDVLTPSSIRAVNVDNSYTGASTSYGMYVSCGDATGTASRYGIYGSSTAGSSGFAYGVRGYATTEGTGSVYAGYFATGNATGGGTEYGVYASATDYGLYVGGGKTYLNSSGLLVGTTTAATGYMVSVNGKIMCEELKVQDSGSWPDYVFDKSYQLNSLHEVEKYIEENNHLPGIPNACTVEENGVEIGNMQKLLLQKIEELTLYMIDADKRIKALETENQALKGH
jgi:hypothetical protein